MPKIVEDGDNSILINRYGGSIWLTIGVEPYHGRARGKNRNALLTAKQARRLAIALLEQAEIYDDAKKSN
jgi:hypothetical protein